MCIRDRDSNQISLVWHNPDLFSKATCGRELHLQELFSILYAVLVTLETTRHPHGDHTDDSRSAQMMCWYPQLSSTHVIKAVFVRFNLCWWWKISYTGKVRWKPCFTMCLLSLHSRIKTQLNRWHHQLLWLYAGEDSPPRGNSSGQISNHYVVQSELSGP